MSAAKQKVQTLEAATVLAHWTDEQAALVDTKAQALTQGAWFYAPAVRHHNP